MGKIYDNWERLVTSVVRREQLRQIALCDSTSSSSNSSRSSSFGYRPSPSPSPVINDSLVYGPSHELFEASLDATNHAHRDSQPRLRFAPSLPSSRGTRRIKWNRGMVAFGKFMFSRYLKVRRRFIHDSGGSEDLDHVMGMMLSQSIHIGNGLEEFPLQLLLEVISHEHKIGTGSFGSVYYSKLDDGREVAIKRGENLYVGATKQGQADKDSEFLNELGPLSRLNHKNIVRLFGYCEDCNEKMLVYEYMNNGSLFDHLHKLEHSPLMSWATRIKVALDAARGIEYLHEYGIPSALHRDIKSSNILLDANWTAKVSDFGLSVMVPHDDKAHLSLCAAGTIGYIDPEYYSSQMFTTKSDVYSFGVVLLELLSGQRPIHKNENGVVRYLVDYVVPYIIQDEFYRVMDPRVPLPTPFEIEAIAYVAYLAADCVTLEGRDRPTMSEVVNCLDRALVSCLESRSTMDSSR